MVGGQEDLQPRLREKANEILRRLSPSEREALLVKCWMSHDARWFMAVAREYGIQAANRLNRVAAHAVGRVEAQRIARVLELPAVTTIDDWLLMQEVFLAFLGPDLADYQLTKVGSNAFQVHAQRCHAHDNVVRAGISDQYECGMLPRIAGWLDALGLSHEISPPLGRCLKAAGGECLYQLTLRFDAEGGDQGNGRMEKPTAGAST